MKVLYGSMMKENSEKYGMAYSGRAPYEVLKTNWVSFDDILKLKEVEAVVEIYYNSFQFENTIRKLSELYESPLNCMNNWVIFTRNTVKTGRNIQE